MASAAVVDGLDPGADRVGRLGVRGELVTVVELGLQGGSEALDLAVVPAHAGASDREQDLQFLSSLRELGRGGLTAPVRVEDHPAGVAVTESDRTP